MRKQNEQICTANRVWTTAEKGSNIFIATIFVKFKNKKDNNVRNEAH